MWTGGRCRELLVAGQGTLSTLLADGITEAPAGASPLEAVAAGLAAAMTAAHHPRCPGRDRASRG